MQRVTDGPTGASRAVSQPVSEEVIGGVTWQWSFTAGGEKQSFLQVIKWYFPAPSAIEGFQAGQFVPGVLLKAQLLEYLFNQLWRNNPVSQILNQISISYLDTVICQTPSCRISEPIGCKI